MKAITTTLFTAGLLAAAGPTWAEEVREVRDAAPDARIEFSAVTGDFTVVGHDAAEFVLEGRLGDDVEELVIEGDSDNWRIELEPVEGNFEWGSNHRSSELTLYVPRASDLELETVSGDMSVRDLSGPALEVESVSGDLELSAIDSAEIDIQTVSGDIQADAVAGEESDFESVSGDLTIRGARGRIDVQAVSGHVDLEATEVSDFESETVSGDLKARLSPTPGATLSLSSHSGSLELHLAVGDTPRIRAETYSGRIESDFGEVEEAGFGPGASLRVDGGSGAVEVEAQTFSGSLTIRRAD
ncbi:MAG: DUF4097 family beta strand repeat-containing protein [Wenzhouxiangella sp.]|jgi:DUF4097 and DUF4098 domain-containing protein YvlB|nr:DUF4097 family beta strand repeat-containing protein [Wenzhouxiangella sp.]